MFGKKISEADYKEVSERYLTAEAAYNNEKLKTEELQKTVIDLQNQINELKSKGIVEPELLNKYKKLEEANALLIKVNNELNAKITANNNKAVQPEHLIDDQKIIQLQNALNAEKSKNAILEEKLKYGGKKMQDELTQWEYKTVETKDYLKDVETLNKAGEQGWEAVAIQNEYSNSQILMKRPKQKQPEYGYSR